MGRAPCCEKDSVKRGPWTPEEDAKLLACIAQHGTGSWRTLPKKAGLQRCGKSCRLRWTNYLRPDLKHGRFTDHEEQLIVKLHAALGSRWSLIAAQLPGRTDNDVKNYWNTRLKKKLCEMGIDPITHKPISQLLADLAGSIAIPKGGQIAEAALGCFKDDMLNVLMRKRPDWQLEGSIPGGPPGGSNSLLRAAAAGAGAARQWDLATSSRMAGAGPSPGAPGVSKSMLTSTFGANEDSAASNMDPVVQKIKQGLSTAVQSKLPVPSSSTAPPPDDMIQQQLKERPESVSPDMLLMRGGRLSPPGMCPFSSPFSGSDMQLPSGYFDSSSGSMRSSGFGNFKPGPASWNEDGSSMLAAHPNTALGLHVGLSGSHQQEHQLYSSHFFQHHSQQHRESSPSSLNTQVREQGEVQVPWSPSVSGSSCSSTTLADVSVLEGVLSSDVPLWDFSELSSIIS